MGAVHLAPPAVAVGGQPQVGLVEVAEQQELAHLPRRRRAAARTGPARGRPRPHAVQPSFSHRSVRSPRASPSHVVQRTSWPSAENARQPLTGQCAVTSQQLEQRRTARYRDHVIDVEDAQRTCSRRARRWRRSRRPLDDARRPGAGRRRGRPARTCRRSPTRRSTATPCGPPTSPRAPVELARRRRAGRRGGRTDRVLGAGRGDADHDRRAGARRRRRGRDGRGHRAARRRPGAPRRGRARRASPCAAPATTCAPATIVFAAGTVDHARRSPACWPASTPAACAAFPRPASPCCRPATSWSTTASPLRPGQIRESNRTMLAPLLAEAGCVVDRLGVVRDDEAALEAVLRDAAADVRRHRHQRRRQHGRLRRRQGRARPDRRDALDADRHQAGQAVRLRHARAATPCPMFGLPGNPVSSLVSFELFARPALRRMMGHRRRRPPDASSAIADVDLRRRPDGKIHFAAGQRRVRRRRPLPRRARSAPRAATSWPPPRSPTRSPCCPTATASPAGADVAVLILDLGH